MWHIPLFIYLFLNYSSRLASVLILQSVEMFQSVPDASLVWSAALKGISIVGEMESYWFLQPMPRNKLIFKCTRRNLLCTIVWRNLRHSISQTIKGPVKCIRYVKHFGCFWYFCCMEIFIVLQRPSKRQNI